MRVGVVFPGQGSQSVGMLSELALTHSIVGQTFDEASDCLGYDLWSLVKNGPQEQLNQTTYTQPALLAAGVAVWRLLTSETSLDVTCVAGHSLGEYTALVCASAIRYTDAIQLVAKRGALMQDAVSQTEGAMAAILGLEDENVAIACDEAAQGEIVSCANYNAPGQVVIAGAAPAVDRAIELCKSLGAKRAMRLAVSVPSHCQLMAPAAKEFSAALESTDWQLPKIPVIHNVDAAVHEDVTSIVRVLGQQLTGSVKWVKCVSTMMRAYHVDTLIESGPGKVLHNLNRRIDKGLASYPVFDETSLAAIKDTIAAAAA